MHSAPLKLDVVSMEWVQTAQNCPLQLWLNSEVGWGHVWQGAQPSATAVDLLMSYWPELRHLATASWTIGWEEHIITLPERGEEKDWKELSTEREWKIVKFQIFKGHARLRHLLWMHHAWFRWVLGKVSNLPAPVLELALGPSLLALESFP